MLGLSNFDHPNERRDAENTEIRTFAASATLRFLSPPLLTENIAADGERRT
jgi:hypothetical protein